MSIEADLLAGMTALVGRRDLAQAQQSDWYAGTADGGPDGDGLYPVTDSAGFTRKVPSLAKITSLAAAAGMQAVLQAVAPFDHIATLAPANQNVGPFGALYVGTPGSVILRTPSGVDITLGDCFAGQIILATFKQVRTGSTAGGLVAMSRLLDPVLAVPELVYPVAPADVDLPDGPTTSVLVGGGGNVSIRMIDGSTAVFQNVPASRRLPIRALAVKAATTASNLLAFG